MQEHLTSYSANSFTSNPKAEVARLDAQVALFWSQELALYQRLGLREGMAVVECGSGPGYLLERLLRQYPETTATAVELDPSFARLCAGRLLALGPQHRVVVAPVEQTGLKSGAFDFAIARLLLEHVSDVPAAAAELMRVLKPGGTAVVVDNDFDYHIRTYPDVPPLAALYDAYCRARAAQGGDARIGRRLPEILGKAGFRGIGLEVVCAHSSLTGDEAFLRSEGAGISSKLVETGFLESSVLDDLASQWRQMLETPGHTIFRQLFVAWGRKPAEADSPEPRASSASAARPSARRHVLPAPPQMGATPEEDLRVLTAFAVSLAAAALDLAPGDVLPHSRLVDLGLDSLAAAAIQSHIDKTCGVHLPVAALFSQGTPASLAQSLAGLLRAKAQDGTGQPKTPDEWEEGEI